MCLIYLSFAEIFSFVFFKKRNVWKNKKDKETKNSHLINMLGSTFFPRFLSTSKCRCLDIISMNRQCQKRKSRVKKGHAQTYVYVFLLCFSIVCIFIDNALFICYGNKLLRFTFLNLLFYLKNVRLIWSCTMSSDKFPIIHIITHWCRFVFNLLLTLKLYFLYTFL